MAVIAISSCAYCDVPLAVAVERIATLCDGVEVRCKGPHRLDSAAWSNRVAGSGLRCSVHAPEEIDIWSADPRRRRAGIAEHERLLEACATAQAELYVIHPDYSEAPVVLRAETRAALQESFAALSDLGRSYSVPVAVENMPGRNNSHLVAPDLDLCGLGLALDVGHAQISGTLEAFLESADIAHLHLHDNLGYGEPDSHPPLGHGCLDASTVQRVLEKHDGLCVLEHVNEADVRASLAVLDELSRSETWPTAVAGHRPSRRSGTPVGQTVKARRAGRPLTRPSQVLRYSD